MYLRALFAPFLGRRIAGLFGRKLGFRGCGVITITALFTRIVLSRFLFYEALVSGAPVVVSLSGWFRAHSLQIDWLLCFDALTASIILTVCTVSCCVHLYSLGYILNDPHLPRFLCYLSLFTGSILFLVRRNDLLTLLVGWERIGVCSFLLISFWFHRLSRTKRRLKAIFVNRVSDTVLLLGAFLRWWYLGSTDLTLLRALRKSSEYSTLLCFCIAGGALGKSAQFGLHVWLADRMEGPTPVSALIHAATLVTAGIFLIARTNPLWELSRTRRRALTVLGAMTRLMRRTMALVQNDVKRVIAYSTCSQLGYIVVALSLSHYGLRLYHLITHACFKALLFLGRGVVIHRSFDNQDIRRRGGAHNSLPLTWCLLLLGSLSLTGRPFLAGYYSKDAILELLLGNSDFASFEMKNRNFFNLNFNAGGFRYLILLLVALFTRTYSFRVLMLVFSFENPNNAKKRRLTRTRRRSSHLLLPPKQGIEEAPKKSISLSGPLPITRALGLLRIFSITGGYLLSDRRIGWGSDFFGSAILGAPRTLNRVNRHMLPVWITWAPFFCLFLGFALSLIFVQRGALPSCINKPSKRIYSFFLNRWGFDFLLNQVFANQVLRTGWMTWKRLDKGIREELGPRGILTFTKNILVPSMQKRSTGMVLDYALVMQFCVLVGLLLLTVALI